jgi:hypothetical protein
MAQPANCQEYKLPDTLYFADQRVPTEYLDVKERLYQIFYSMVYDKKGKVSHWLGKSGMFIPRIQQQLANAGVHTDFAYIAVAESELNHRISSPVAASGLWQFMKPTGQRFNLRMDKQCDERNLLDKSTEAAGKYLYHLQNNVFNADPFLTMAAYNNGEGNVLKMLKAQKVNSFWEAISNTETSDYVCRVIVYKELMSNPKRYGFDVVTYNDYLSDTEYFTLVNLKKNLDYSIIASYLNISYRQFYMLNPHISHIGYNKGGFFDKKTSLGIIIPSGKSIGLNDSLVSNGYLKSITGDSVNTTSDSISVTDQTDTEKEEEKTSFIWHTVKENSLGEIAFKYKRDWHKIAAENNLKIIELNSGVKVAEIRKGQKIKIYKDL